MSKRKVQFDDGDAVDSSEPIWKQSKSGKVDAELTGDRIRTFKSDHTLDSDEEPEDNPKDEKYELSDDDVEGAEDTEVTFFEGTKVTPFNLKEEMTEGHFDGDGNYFVKKEEEIQDNWLDNIDWVRVKERPLDNKETGEAEEPDTRPENEIFTEILALLKPGETITKALKRLGGSKQNSRRQNKKTSQKTAREKNEKEAKDGDAERNKNTSQKMAQEKNEKEAKDGDAEKNKEDMLRLTGLTDDILCRGNYEVYGYTFERIQHLIVKKEIVTEKEKTDPSFDIFGDIAAEDDKLAKPTLSEERDVEQVTMSDVVNWEFKWDNQEQSKIYGPYPSEQMQQWVEEEYFKDGVFVRKVGSEQNFYTSKRIDFDLYT